MTIYLSDIEKVEISANGTVLRRTIYKNDGPHEYLYQRESNPTQIREIEDRSVNWRLRGEGSPKGYYVEIQLNAENKATGNIRIVSHRNAKKVATGIFSSQLIVEERNYIYYVRRKGNAI